MKFRALGVAAVCAAAVVTVPTSAQAQAWVFHMHDSGALAAAHMSSDGGAYASVSLHRGASPARPATLYVYGTFPDTCLPVADGGTVCGWHHVDLRAEVPVAAGGIAANLSSATVHLEDVENRGHVTGEYYDRSGVHRGWVYGVDPGTTDVDVVFTAVGDVQRSATHGTACLGGEFSCQSVAVGASTAAEVTATFAGRTLTTADFTASAPRIAAFKSVETGRARPLGG
ncbi:hypothetical protein NUM3379_16210 [Kineococcus sp. NUM-3379]